VKTGKAGGATVLTTASGMTLYTFAKDTTGKSNCTGSCAQIWPPAAGPVKAGPGVTGTLGTITRSGGGKQVTFNGHPLYTYVGDTAPGQAKGNGLNSSGGIWHSVTPSGAAVPAPSASGSKSGGGYGY
jgi:predicted lipoprotein with Yx(FWY)xxD motif